MELLKDIRRDIGTVIPLAIAALYVFAAIFTAVVMLGGGNG